MTRPVVRAPAAAYRPPMPWARLLRFLTIVSLALMPVGMIPGGHFRAEAHAASAAPPANQAMSAHCAEMDGQQPARPWPQHQADCAIACSALPSFAAIVSPPHWIPALRQPMALSPSRRGLHPEAATPPPRPC